MVVQMLFIFGIQGFIHLVSLNIPASKIGALSMNPKIQNVSFLKNCVNDFD
jgi:hypothetical protein